MSSASHHSAHCAASEEIFTTPAVSATPFKPVREDRPVFESSRGPSHTEDFDDAEGDWSGQWPIGIAWDSTPAVSATTLKSIWEDNPVFEDSPDQSEDWDDLRNNWSDKWPSSDPVETSPSTSATQFKTIWEGQPVFESSDGPIHIEDINDVDNNRGGNWPVGNPWDTNPPSRPPIDNVSHHTATQRGSSHHPTPHWDTSPLDALPPGNTHFSVFSSAALLTSSGNRLTTFLLHSNRDTLFHGTIPTREWLPLTTPNSGSGTQFAPLPMTLVPAHALFPTYTAPTLKFTGSLASPAIFVKRQAILTGGRLTSAYHADATAQEVSRCEAIAAAPHAHLARYLGVETRVLGGAERVVGIVYQRYGMDLYEFGLMRRLVKAEHVGVLMRGIEAGMRHLHGLGVVHCDLRPQNVFVSFEEAEDGVRVTEVVVGDFDACVRIGEPVRLKRACEGWWPEEMGWGEKAGVWVDEWCLAKMETWIKEKADVWDFGGKASAWPSVHTDDELVSDILTAMPNQGW